jgi:hypothetical protein
MQQTCDILTFNCEFHLYTDASDYAVGGVLMQEHDSALHPVTWSGRKLGKSEIHYETHENELLAIVFATRQWRCYLESSTPTIIHTDHNPLQWLQTQQRLTGKQARWLESSFCIN